MEQAVSQVRKVGFLELRRIRQIRRFIDEEATKQLVVSFVLSRIDYCNRLYKGINEEKINRLQSLQNQAARLVKMAPKTIHVSPILKELHWLPVKARIDHKILTLSFKSLHDATFPSYLKDMIEIYQPGRSLRSKNKNILKKPKTKLKTFGDRSFYYSAPDLWNGLPERISNAPSVFSFRKNVKTWLFQSYYK